ncbi:MAG TPA: heparinase II/III family protein, partial [Leptolinea sp.]
MNSLERVFKTISQVGLLPVLQVGLYRFGLLTGHYQRISEKEQNSFSEKELAWINPVSAIDKSEPAVFLHNHPELKESCFQETRLILNGKCRIFGHQIVDIFWDGLDTSHHWTEYELGKVQLPVQDIKFIWEPARLGWVFTLGRAYAFGETSIPGNAAWMLIDKFLELNPANYGPNWMNGQEVALRILAFAFFHEAFRDYPGFSAGWEQTLALTVAKHAQRILLTLVYARSQQNNHILVEAAGLYTAGVFLPNHPQAGLWRETGWQMFHQALDEQIQEDGTYCQFSTNYQRLMLQTALWVRSVSLRVGDVFPEKSSQKLAAATHWLINLIDPESGKAPNYGHNDGAYVLPLTGSSFSDYLPVVETAVHFFGQGVFS